MKKEKILLPVALMTAILILNLNGVASAADNNSAVNEITNGLTGGGAGFGTTFQTQLSNLSKSLLSSAKIIAVIMTAAAGCMVCFGIQDGKKTFWNWILGIGLAINFGDLILNLWGVQYATAPTKIEDYKLLLKNEDDPAIDILSPFMRYYISVIMSGAAVIAPYAINLTLILAMIDGAIKVSFDLISGDKIKFLVTTILKVGFFIFLIQSWVQDESIDELLIRLKHLCLDKQKAPVICLDYLQIVPSSKESTKLGVDDSVRKLKNFFAEMDRKVVDNERQNGYHILHSLIRKNR